MRKFSSKIFLMILFLVIVPFSAVNLFGRIRLERFFMEELSSHVIQTVSKNQSYISDAFQDIVYFSNTFVYDEELRNRISSEEYTEYDNSKYFDYILNRTSIENFQGVWDQARVLLLDQFGRVYSNWSRNYRDYQFILEEDWVKRAYNAKGHVSWSFFQPSYVEEEKEERYISLARAILMDGTAGEPIGVLIISIDQEEFSSLMMEYAYEDDEAYICIDEGEILLASKNHSISEKNLKQIYSDTKEEKNGSLKRTVGDKEYLISFSTFPHPWLFDGQEMKLFHFTDYYPVREQISQATAIINVITVLSVIVVAFISFFASKKLVAPVGLLTRTMESYTPEQEIKGLDLKRRDEIGRLNMEFVRMGERIKRLFHQVEEESREKERYHYESLRAQLNPHFLFNTLTSIRWMAMIRGADNIVDSIDAMAGILKYSMSRDGELVNLEAELENVSHYISIHNLRYMDYAKLVIDVEEQYRTYKTLKFILQPVAENSVIHGFDKTKASITIRISAEQKGNTLFLYVEDDGLGISDEYVKRFQEERIQKGKSGRLTGIGLTNVDAYIKIRYGEEFGLWPERREQGGTRVTFRLPVIREDVRTDEDGNGCG